MKSKIISFQSMNIFHEHKNHIKMRVSKKTITILTVCLLTFAGTQNAQAQTEEYSYYPRFMENFWKNENIYAKMITNQFLAIKSGKELIDDIEKGEQAVEDYNTGRSSDREYALALQYIRDKARERLSQFLDDKILKYENEETRPLMDYYSELLVMDGWNANSWKLEFSVEIDDDFHESGDDLMNDCRINTKINFSKDGSFISTMCSYANQSYDEDCDCETDSGKWHLSGTKLYLEFENEDDEGFLYIWFMNNKLYIMDEYMEQLIIFSRSDEK